MAVILVTGGAGYIGSHTLVELLNSGYETVIVDNLSNSKREVVDKIRAITGKKPAFVEADIRDGAAMKRLFNEYDIDAVIHFAGLKAVGESVKKPLAYYDNNVCGTIRLLEAMKEHGVHKLIFSSSATVYKEGNPLPLNEEGELGCTNPYGWTKLTIEQILRDECAASSEWSVALLRYFNPIGAHETGLIGEDPNGIPNNLMPYISRVAAGRLDKLHVFGNDYSTPDGTGVRDYIHVVDLAKGHVSALEYIEYHNGCEAINLGTGRGYSVLEVVEAYKRASGRDVPYVIDGRRPGDLAEFYADPEKALTLLGWRAEYGIEDMCAHSWLFESGL